ncbi:ribosome small subunit-dependent GTPase A [Asticcacaulis sp.]|uniref:ribosome small subunit-dependent GTPase A n=1 Tax=Asticcacaulis sp. TaxID=1872648 RepID=UPI002B672809|nr:ribosome small subunit-dependent GTPase A [Asticcacaulis sp.]HTM79916.1 ribosome small subunit-dependent GTPase A [Asticcacaulis sp.]
MADTWRASPSLVDLGWTDFFADQWLSTEEHFAPQRIAEVHRARLSAISPAGTARLVLPHGANTGQYAVGDWVLVEPETHVLHRRLDRSTLLQRHIEGKGLPQLAAANVDTLFIVTSCNADFNPARLERYLAMANEAGTAPVIVLTKADTVSDALEYQRQASALQRDVPVVTLNARSADAAQALEPWCQPCQTVALAGSSGVGKSTLVNTLAGSEQMAPQETGGIREHDAKGRHTTTARSLHAISGGGWIIDTPGMRNLHVGNVAYGIDTLFAEITELAPLCKFRDCTHAHEPGCAVRAAVAAGSLPEDRLTRWRKLLEENISNTPVQTGPRGNRTTFGKSR